MSQNIYFDSDLVNAINNHLRLKISCCVKGIINLKCLLIEFVIQNLSQISFQIYLKRTFQNGF